MKRLKRWKKVLLGIIIVLAVVGIQFIPYGHAHSDPAVVAEPNWNSAGTRDIFFRACADCHSNETHWPWYSYVAPVSWLVQNDVSEGRAHLDVSMWGVQRRNHGRDAAGQVERGDMPLWYYLPMHPKAKLSKAEKTAFINGLKATFGAEREGRGRRRPGARQDRERQRENRGEREGDDD